MQGVEWVTDALGVNSGDVAVWKPTITEPWSLTLHTMLAGGHLPTNSEIQLEEQ